MKNHLALALLIAPLVGCGSKTPPSASGPTLPRAVSAGVGGERGGRVGDEDGASVTLPPGAVDRLVQIAMKPSPPETHETADVRVLGPVWSVTVDGEEHFRFAKPVRLAIPYDPARMQGETPVGLSVWEEGRWLPVPGARADAATKLVVAEVDHFTEYAPTQFPPRAPGEAAKRFLDNQSWYGSVRIAIHGAGRRHNEAGGSDRSYTVSRDAEVRFVIKAMPGEAESIAVYEHMGNQSSRMPAQMAEQLERLRRTRHWMSATTNSAPADEDEYSLRVNDQYDARDEDWGEGGKMGPDILTKRTLSGGDSGKGAGTHQLEIDVERGTYTLTCQNLRAGTLTYVETGENARTETQPAAIGWLLKDRKLPQGGSVLSDTMPIPRKDLHLFIPDLGNWDFDFGSLGGTITWTLSPTPFEDVELVIKPEGYDDWMPEGGADEASKGNSIRLTATLRHRGIGPTKATLKTLVLRLDDVSRVPGVCLNRPLTGGADTPDLKFAAGSDGTIDDDGARLTKKGEFTEVKFEIESFDWGAWGAIRGSGTLTDGRPVWATLDGDPSVETVRLPKRDPGSKVADKWKSEMGVEGLPDAEDKDKQDGNTHDGDGLTLYEEYRGLIAKGKHTRKAAAGKDGVKPLTPQAKDLVVYLDKSIRGKPGVDPGLLLFETASKIHVVEVDDGEMPDSRVVNVNAEKSLTAGPQHGLKMFDAQGSTADTGGETSGVQQKRGDPYLSGSPAGWEKITVDLAGLAATYAGSSKVAHLPYTLGDDLANTVAHELAHGVGVKEHGPTDIVRLASTRIDAASPLQVFDRAGNPVTKPVDIVGVVGNPGCEASGDPDCILCYNEYYTWAYHGGDGLYMVPIHAPGKIFCRSNQGVERNASRKVGTRTVPGLFGSSVPGNCLGQMKVKDQ